MNSLREAVTTQIPNTEQPLSTKKRWMVINKEIVFGNGIIPYTDYSGNSITSILNHLLTEDIQTLDSYLAGIINNRAKTVAQKLQKVGIHNYYDFIMASWNNTNWVFDSHCFTKDQELLHPISAYSLYLTSIGDVDKALDSMQWDYWSFWRWKWDISTTHSI